MAGKRTGQQRDKIASKTRRRRRASKAFTKTNVAGHRFHEPENIRTSALNVRVTPQQYLLWRRIADEAGLSLSAWGRAKPR